jgi:hypothetical protein
MSNYNFALSDTIELYFWSVSKNEKYSKSLKLIFKLSLKAFIVFEATIQFLGIYSEKIIRIQPN